MATLLAAAGTAAACAPAQPPAVEAAPAGAAAGPESAASAPAAAGAAASEVAFTKFDDAAYIRAKKSGAPFVIYFEADWCSPCKEMHAKTLRAPAVVEAAAGIPFLRVDVTKPDSYVDRVQQSFHVLGAPTVILFGPEGQERARQFGYVPPADFVKLLAATRQPRPNT